MYIASNNGSFFDMLEGVGQQTESAIVIACLAMLSTLAGTPDSRDKQKLAGTPAKESCNGIR